MNNKTLFILGAGASKPYGLPLSSELRKYIIDDFNNLMRDYYRDTGSIVDAQRQIATREADAFTKVFKYSDTKSIDLFLSRNPRYSNIGKQAIILSILKKENKDKFRENCEIPEFNWYSFLFNKMLNNILKSDDYAKILKNNYSFITFNYDRSFEYYLLESFSNSFSEIKPDEKINTINKIPILHVYGSIDNLASIPYGGKLNFLNIKTPINNIKTPFDSHELNLIHNEIVSADRIFILGFAYADENMQILNLKKQTKKNCQIICCSFGIAKNESRKIDQNYFSGLKVNWGNNEWDIVELLKQKLDYIGPTSYQA